MPPDDFDFLSSGDVNLKRIFNYFLLRLSCAPRDDFVIYLVLQWCVPTYIVILWRLWFAFFYAVVSRLWSIQVLKSYKSPFVYRMRIE